MSTANKILVLFSFFSLLVGVLLHREDLGPSIERTLSTRLPGMEIGELRKISDLIEGRWDVACVMRPYQKELGDNGDERVRDINKRLRYEGLCPFDECWHLVLINGERLYVAKIDYGAETIRQSQHSDFIKEVFFKADFKPLECADFKEGYFIRYYDKSISRSSGDLFLTFGVKTL